MVNEFMSVNVQVDAVRFRGNGAIFTGRVLGSGCIQADEELVVRIPRNVLYPRNAVFKGETWEIEGWKEIYKGNPQLAATKACLKRPIGKNFIAAVAFNPKFKGIGEKRARDIWETFGEQIYDTLEADEPDISALQQILSPEDIEIFLQGWKDEYPGNFYRWMDKHQIPRAIRIRMQEYYGGETIGKIEEDPYRILAFGQPWRVVDDAAHRLGIARDDPRRLHAAVAEVLYRHFAKGHTAISTEGLTRQVTYLLNQKSQVGVQDLTKIALKHTYTEGAFVRNGELWQAAGIYLIEAFVAERIRKLASAANTNKLFQPDDSIEHVISLFEKRKHLLSNEQKAAIRLAVKSRCCVITGGAGSGKTSVLSCVHDVVEAINGSIFQMALSGKAAKRMEETTGRPARTIAGFLVNTTHEDLENVTHIVIDEASMLDIVSAFHILQKLPDHINVVLVGDQFSYRLSERD